MPPPAGHSTGRRDGPSVSVHAHHTTEYYRGADLCINARCHGCASEFCVGVGVEDTMGDPRSQDACAPQKHYWYLRPPSCGPVFDPSARDPTKVCEIAREKGRVTGHDNRRGFIKRQYWDPAAVVQMLRQPTIGCNLMRHRPRTCQIRHPAPHLFLITDDRRHHFCRGHVGQAGTQAYRAWLVAPLQHAQMSGFDIPTYSRAAAL